MELFILRYLPTLALLIAIGIVFSFADYKPESTYLTSKIKSNSVSFTKSTNFIKKYQSKLDGKSGLVEGTFYKIDSTNITYLNNKTCLHPSNNQQIRPENNLDQIGSSDKRHSYLIVAVTNAYKYKRKCQNTAQAPIEAINKTSNPQLENGTLYRIDGQNLLYSSTGSCIKKNNNDSFLQTRNNLDQTGSSDSRHAELLKAVSIAYKNNLMCI